MENVLTDEPPPSRFLAADLNVFSRRLPPPPPPLLLLPPLPTSPPLLLVLLHPLPLHLPSSTFLGSLVLPEHPLSTTPPSPIHSLPESSSLVLRLTTPIPPHRAVAVGKVLLTIGAEKVVVVEEGWRGGKVETRGGGVGGVEWLESGRVVEGVAAAVVAECERKGRKGAAVVVSKEMELERVLEAVLGVGVGRMVVGGKMVEVADSGLYT